MANLNITIDNFDQPYNPKTPWTAAVEQLGKDGIWERGDSSSGATPQEALENLLREHGKEHGL